jgi:hypothetical protein
MNLLDLFALIILLTLLVAIVGGALFLGWLPGRIARRRNNPQAEAIAVCGWMGLLTLGILLPLAYIWAFWNSQTNSPSDDAKLDGLSPAIPTNIEA